MTAEPIRWHVQQPGGERGLLTIEEIGRLAKDHKLTPATFVRGEGESQWTPAGMRPELAPHFEVTISPSANSGPPPPVVGVPTLQRPLWPWIVGAGCLGGVCLVGIFVILLMLVILERIKPPATPTSEHATNHAPRMASALPEGGNDGSSVDVTISGADATPQLIEMLAELTPEQRLALGLSVLSTGQDYFAARIKISNFGSIPVFIDPRCIKLQSLGQSIGVHTVRDSRFLQATNLEPNRYLEGMVIYRADVLVGAALRSGEGKIIYYVE